MFQSTTQGSAITRMATQRKPRGAAKSTVRRDELSNGEVATIDNRREDVQRKPDPGTSETVERIVSSGLDEFLDNKVEDINTGDFKLFGQSDATEFSDNPFEVAPNTYWAALIEATPKVNEDGAMSVKMVWQIEESASEFDGNKVTKYQPIVNKPASDMSPEEKRTMKFWKMTLRNGFDFSEEQMNTLAINDLLGRKAFITTKNNEKDGTVYTNIVKVLSKRRYEEENEKVNEAVTSGGFGI